MRGGNFWRCGLGKSEWVRNLLGYDIYTWHLNPTIFTVYRFNNVFSTFHTPPKSAPGAPFYIRTNHEKLLGLIVLNLRNIFLQSCFRVPSRWKVPLMETQFIIHIHIPSNIWRALLWLQRSIIVIILGPILV